MRSRGTARCAPTYLHYNFSMPYNSSLHHRRSIRIPGFDYSQPGLYFITIVTSNRIAFFGKLLNDEFRINGLGAIAREEWFLASTKREYLTLYDNEFVVMPNHVHGILHIVNAKEVKSRIEHSGRYGSMLPGSVPAIVRAYKSAVTRKIHEIKGENIGPIWQRNYYEHVIRNETEYNQIQKYIQNNPLNWKNDPEIKCVGV